MDHPPRSNERPHTGHPKDRAQRRSARRQRTSVVESRSSSPRPEPVVDEPVRAVREESTARGATPAPVSTAGSRTNTAPSPMPNPGGAAITVDLLHDLWPKIRLDIKARDRRIEALLSSCDPADVNGSAITLVTSYKFHWEKMNEDASRELIESVIGRLVNQTVTVTTEIRGANGASPSSAPRDISSSTTAGSRRSRNRTTQGRAIARRSDGNRRRQASLRC